MHYTVAQLKPKNKYKITFHNNSGITYGSVNVWSIDGNFNSIIVSLSDYEKSSALINTVTDGLRYDFVERDSDGFRPIRNSSSSPAFVRFMVNNYFKATARLLPTGG